MDTYDTLTSGLPNAVTVFKELRAAGRPVRAAVRLDSGDLARLSKAAYRMFTEAGFPDPLIVASNELDEDLIADLKRQGARINSWGVGTHLITSSGHPALSGVYKLVAVQEDGGAWEPRIKLSSNPAKMTDPGRKRLVRYYDEAGHPLADLIRLDGEPADSIDPGQPAAPVPFAERQDLSFLRAVWDASRCEDLLRARDAGRGTYGATARARRHPRPRAATGGVAARRGAQAAEPRDLRGGSVAAVGVREGAHDPAGPGRAARRPGNRTDAGCLAASLHRRAPRPPGSRRPAPWRSPFLRRRSPRDRPPSGGVRRAAAGTRP